MTQGLMCPASAMRAYYDRRAPEYDSWWLGTGVFAERVRPGWDAERDRVCALVASLPPARVLDVACGTGFLTRHLRGEVTGLDQSPRMAAIASGRVGSCVVGEAVPLPFADRSFDRVFTATSAGTCWERSDPRSWTRRPASRPSS